MADLLLTFGFCWMIVAALLGLALGGGHIRHREALAAAARAGDLAGYNTRVDGFGARGTAHAHAFLWSVVCILVALVLNRLPFGQWALNSLPLTMMGATVIWTGGAVIRSTPIMAVADIVFFLLLFVVAGGLFAASFHFGA